MQRQLIQHFTLNAEGELIANKGNIRGLSKCKLQSKSILAHVPILESLLYNTELPIGKQLHLPNVESNEGVMRGKIYHLFVEKVIKKGEMLLKCKIEDVTERTKILLEKQQQQHERIIKQQKS